MGTITEFAERIISLLPPVLVIPHELQNWESSFRGTMSIPFEEADNISQVISTGPVLKPSFEIDVLSHNCHRNNTTQVDKTLAQVPSRAHGMVQHQLSKKTMHPRALPRGSLRGYGIFREPPKRRATDRN